MSDTEVFDSIMRGLDEAVAHSRGELVVTEHTYPAKKAKPTPSTAPHAKTPPVKSSPTVRTAR